MSNKNSVELGAKSAAMRQVDGETEVWFLTDDNLSVRIKVPEAVMNSLAKRIADVTRRKFN